MNETGLLVLNFAHPLTDGQQAQITELTGQPIAQLLTIPCQFENDRPFVDQVRALLAEVDLPSETWQTAAILINPPSYAPVALALLAELHGRMGYFPPAIRIRPRPNSVPMQYEVAELLNLQQIRADARQTR